MALDWAGKQKEAQRELWTPTGLVTSSVDSRIRFRHPIYCTSGMSSDRLFCAFHLVRPFRPFRPSVSTF